MTYIFNFISGVDNWTTSLSTNKTKNKNFVNCIHQDVRTLRNNRSDHGGHQNNIFIIKDNPEKGLLETLRRPLGLQDLNGNWTMVRLCTTKPGSVEVRLTALEIRVKTERSTHGEWGTYLITMVWWVELGCPPTTLSFPM